MHLWEGFCYTHKHIAILHRLVVKKVLSLKQDVLQVFDGLDEKNTLWFYSFMAYFTYNF